MIGDKQKQANADRREKYKKNPEREDHDNDGSTLSREKVTDRWALVGKKYLAERNISDTNVKQQSNVKENAFKLNRNKKEEPNA